MEDRRKIDNVKKWCNRMKFFILGIILFLFEANCSGVSEMNNRYVPADYVVIADDISNAMRIKLMERFKDLDMTTIGVTSGIADCVRLMGFDFQIRGPLPKEQIREIIVDSVEDFLKAINSNEKIRSSLKNYPFTSNGIRISLIIYDKNNNDIFYPEISSAFISRGNIYYFYADKEDIHSFKSEEEENYETAKKIVYENRNK